MTSRTWSRKGLTMPRLLYIFILWSLPAQASSPDLYGYGTRAMGMAGLLASHARGHDAVYHNPAGLLSDERPSCAVFSFGAQSLRLDGRTFDTPTSQTHIGGAIPLPLGGFMTERLPWVLGLSYQLRPSFMPSFHARAHHTFPWWVIAPKRSLCRGIGHTNS